MSSLIFSAYILSILVANQCIYSGLQTFESNFLIILTSTHISSFFNSFIKCVFTLLLVHNFYLLTSIYSLAIANFLNLDLLYIISFHKNKKSSFKKIIISNFFQVIFFNVEYLYTNEGKHLMKNS